MKATANWKVLTLEDYVNHVLVAQWLETNLRFIFYTAHSGFNGDLKRLKYFQPRNGELAVTKPPTNLFFFLNKKKRTLED